MSKDDTKNPGSHEASAPPANGRSVFDNMDVLRHNQDFGGLVNAKRHMSTVPVGKPGPQVWFRVLAGQEWQLAGAVVKWDEDGTQFFVHPTLVAELAQEVSLAVLRTVVTAQGGVRIWPTKLPQPDGTDYGAWESARTIAQRAETEWIRMVWNREASGYDVFTTQLDLGEPQLPEQSFQDVLRIAFSGKEIDSLDHPVVAKLRGRIR